VVEFMVVSLDFMGRNQ